MVVHKNMARRYVRSHQWMEHQYTDIQHEALRLRDLPLLPDRPFNQGPEARGRWQRLLVRRELERLQLARGEY